MNSLVVWADVSKDRRPLLTWTLAFWAATYLLFTLRSQLNPDEATIVLSARRLVSITAGAAFFALALVAARDWVARGRPGLRLLWTVIPASLIVLVVRFAVNDLGGAEIPFVTDVRWMLTWSSYFALGLGIFLLAHREGAAGRLVRHAAAAVNARRAVAIAAHGSKAALAGPASATPLDEYEWLIDTLATELAVARPAQRETLIARLQQRAGYELADPDDPISAAHNARVTLVARLAAHSA